MASPAHDCPVTDAQEDQTDTEPWAVQKMQGICMHKAWGAGAEKYMTSGTRREQNQRPLGMFGSGLSITSSKSPTCPSPTMGSEHMGRCMLLMVYPIILKYCMLLITSPNPHHQINTLKLWSHRWSTCVTFISHRCTCQSCTSAPGMGREQSCPCMV